MFVEKTILLISPEKWGTNFVSKHHYASLLVSKGNIVYFLNPPSSTQSIEEVSKNLFVINYKMPRGLNKFPKKVRKFIHRILWNRIKHKFYLRNPDVVWSFDPYVFQDLSIFNKDATKIYHPVDVHYTILDYECVHSANFVFSTSHLVLDKFKKKKNNQKTFFINHGLSGHFLDPLIINKNYFPAIETDSNYKIGYVGNLRYKHLNFDILFRLIEKYSHFTFYFLGPYEISNLSSMVATNEAEIEKLKGCKNVVLLGPRPSDHIPAFLSKMDMLIMIYNGDKMRAEMANPHKILEYLSSGKTIVTNFIHEYRNKRDLISMVDNNSEYLEMFHQLIGKTVTNEVVQNRITYAKENTYEKQLSRIEEIIFDK